MRIGFFEGGWAWLFMLGREIGLSTVANLVVSSIFRLLCFSFYFSGSSLFFAVRSIRSVVCTTTK